MDGQVSTQGDVYSYGILLLEIFTGRRPTDELFKDDLNLHKFAKMVLPGQVMEIVDQSILHGKTGAAENLIESLSSWTSEQIGCLISVLKVGVKCSAESPRDRMNTREVTLELLLIRDKFLGIEMHEEELRSPVNRRPTNELFQDNFNLHTFAKMALPGRVMVIVDESLLYENIEERKMKIERSSSLTSKQIECLILMLQVGVKCSAASPRDRMTMREVALTVNTAFSKRQLSWSRNA
ncbi:hypothetical protein F0562_001075 [Nyssa sinensis]|uniref:Serine-threonine/tyrosine-protein kinase catalytic domain-containing protein n=1 Tax=Nyssa sinensis TaxID=561372 RepID=A0A5J5C6Y6_9ASTE|nr:hypothetical protein F0562_001075 [Nyssa sinensis]